MIEIPAPIPDRIGEVGGIESMTVDGRRWYFGFCFDMDIVVSPLIDDPDVMAAFASKHMVQNDGAHDAMYWRELVDASIKESYLVREDSDRTFDSASLAANRFTPSYHLTYLLGAAMGLYRDGFFEDPAARSALRTAGIDYEPHMGWECFHMCKAALQDPGRAAAAAFLMNGYVDFVLRKMPANWAEVFSAMRP